MGFLASYKSSGWLWLSRLVVETFCANCSFAAVMFDTATYVLEIRPIRTAIPSFKDPNWVSIHRIYDAQGGAVLNIPDLLPYAQELKCFGQYLPRWDETTGTIIIKLKERTKKYGK